MVRERNSRERDCSERCEQNVTGMQARQYPPSSTVIRPYTRRGPGVVRRQLLGLKRMPLPTERSPEDHSEDHIIRWTQTGHNRVLSQNKWVVVCSVSSVYVLYVVWERKYRTVRILWNVQSWQSISVLWENDHVLSEIWVWIRFILWLTVLRIMIVCTYCYEISNSTDLYVFWTVFFMTNIVYFSLCIVLYSDVCHFMLIAVCMTDYLF